MTDEVDGIELECPSCGAALAYEAVEPVDDWPHLSRCPECGDSFPTDCLFE